MPSDPTGALDYDEHTAARMLATLHACPAGRRLDTLAAVVKLFVEDQHAEWWGYPKGAINR